MTGPWESRYKFFNYCQPLFTSQDYRLVPLTLSNNKTADTQRSYVIMYCEASTSASFHPGYQRQSWQSSASSKGCQVPRASCDCFTHFEKVGPSHFSLYSTFLLNTRATELSFDHGNGTDDIPLWRKELILYVLNPLTRIVCKTTQMSYWLTRCITKSKPDQVLKKTNVYPLSQRCQTITQHVSKSSITAKPCVCDTWCCLKVVCTSQQPGVWHDYNLLPKLIVVSFGKEP